MNQSKDRWDSILRIEAVGFLIIIGLSWLVEAIRLPYLFFGEPFIPNWRRAVLRTIVLIAIWTWVHLMTRRLLRRLHYLEEFLRVCAWCRKVCEHDQWLTMEEYFDSKFAMRTTHGMCPECRKLKLKELEEKENSPSVSG